MADINTQIDELDRQLAAHRGPDTDHQRNLLRRRRELLLEMHDRRTLWGD